MKIKILQGLPGSGKSTWAKKFVEENPDWIRINRDDLRNMRGKYWLPKQEDMITEWEDSCIASALASGYNVILDATNLNNDRNKSRLKRISTEYNVEFDIETIVFDTSLEECIKRDLVRPNSVGEKVITQMYNKYLAPKPVKYTEDSSLPHCVIFDIDGTLAKMNGRSPYDWNRVGEDSVNEPIRVLNQMAAFYHSIRDRKIIIFTGRDGSCLQETKDWLVKNVIDYDEIYIREAGDCRKDSIVKRELFDNHIKGKYYVDFVVDDRNQVVDMWRKDLGITCLQVDYGDF